MRPVNIRQSEMKYVTIPIGFEGENEFTQVRINCEDTFAEHPNAFPSMIVTDPLGNKYPVVVTRDSNEVVWNVVDSDLTSNGNGEIQIEFIIDGNIVGRTDVAKTEIKRSIFINGDAPEAITHWETNANATLAEVNQALQDIPDSINTALAVAKESGEFDGPQGPQGIPGEKGDTGDQGPQGEKGDKGDTGLQGPQGIQGPKGDKGDTGATGPQGPQGIQGIPGEKGDTGAQGPKGDPGEDGYTPIKGIDYFDGAQGPKGDKGDTGAQGPKGDPGNDGYTPIKGIDYFDGAQGPKGDKGDTGAQGPKGDKGDSGIQGPKGDTGDTGPSGQNGSDGFSPTISVTDITGGHRVTITDSTGPHSFDVMNGSDATAPVQDVQVDGTSVLDAQGVANIPYASSSDFGLVSIASGLARNESTKKIYVQGAVQNTIKLGNDVNSPITPGRQHISAYYALAKLAGVDLANESVTLGQYPSNALVAIQKMLGIYQAPWELIRSETVTNATKANINISTDSYGNSFELTDVRVVVYLPTQDTEAKVEDYGRVKFVYGNSDSVQDTLYIGSWTQTSGSAGKGAQVWIEQNNGMIERRYSASSSQGNSPSVTFNNSFTGNGVSHWELESKVYTKIIIESVTGTCNYTVYGRRKWS